MRRKTVTLQIRIDPDYKNKSEKILKNLGISLTTGIRMFLHQVVNTGGMPFTPSLDDKIDDNNVTLKQKGV